MAWNLRRPGTPTGTAIKDAEDGATPNQAGPLPIVLIIGLGNPGPAYAGTRHNVGFWVVNRLAKRLNVDIGKHSKLASIGEGEYQGRPIVLAKPRTFMNDSGNAIRELLRRYKLSPEQMLLIGDDLDLPVGRVRLRQSGGHGGQKGMRSVVAQAGTQDFPRLRIGIGRPVVGDRPTWDPEHISSWVLGNPPSEQKKALEAAADLAVDAVLCSLDEGVEVAMNRFNRN
jgi:PTH1 family peptidyl-tRNA hydrolase